MVWQRLDDRLHSHPKAAEAGLEAIGLWALSLSHVGDHRTDGHVSRAVASRLAMGAKKAEKLANRLVDAGLWEPHESGDGWQFHDYLDHNPSREEVEANRETLSLLRAEAGRRGAAARWQRDGKPDGKPMAIGMANGCQTDGPDPDPGREDPPPPPGAPPLAAEDGKPKREKPRTACPPSDATREDLLAWLAKHKIPSDHAELEGFLDWHRKERKLSADWPASWRTWTRNAAKWNRGSGTRIASAHVQPVPEDGPLWKVGGGL